MPYQDALALQRTLVDERQAGRTRDVLLLLQHPHVITLGVKTGSARSHIVAEPDVLAARGVEVQETGRGGDVTYHGPDSSSAIQSSTSSLTVVTSISMCAISRS